MPYYSWLLSSLLASQIGGSPSLPAITAPPAANPQRPTAAATSTADEKAGHPNAGQSSTSSIPAASPTGAARPQSSPLRPTTAQLVADALTLPTGNTIGGQPVSLVSVVATAPERQRQTEAIHAYWKLADAIGEYRCCYERQQRVARLRAGNGEAADLRTAQADAAAQVREAEVQVTTAQHDLAEILLLTPGTPLPLPEDRPLVGPYRTQFAQLFAGKQAPQRARMLDQTLPLRGRAVEGHAAALLAAEDTLDAAIELQAGGQESLAGVLSALDSHIRQQRAFLAAVCRYNHDIADYALAVVPPQTTPDIIVGTLIKQNRPAAQPVMPLPTTATLPATYLAPAPTRGAGVPPAISGAGVPPAIPNQPTRRPAARCCRYDAGNGPAGWRGRNLAYRNRTRRCSQFAARQRARGTPTGPAAGIGYPSGPGETGQSGIAARGRRSDRRSHHAPSQKPVLENGLAQTSVQGAYAGLAGLTPAAQTNKLTTILYSERNLSAGVGQPSGLPADKAPVLRLIDCLRMSPAGSRTTVIETYWAACQVEAQYQNLAEQTQWLEALRPTLSAQSPPLPTAMLKLRAARLAVEADRADTEAERTAARFQLSAATGLGTEKTLPQAASLPFVGHWPLPASSSDNYSWSHLRLKAIIPQREAVITARAAVVVAADASRAAAAADFMAGRVSVERVLARIGLQAHETSAFLESVTAYNRAIAQYACQLFPQVRRPRNLSPR